MKLVTATPDFICSSTACMKKNLRLQVAPSATTQITYNVDKNQYCCFKMYYFTCRPAKDSILTAFQTMYTSSSALMPNMWQYVTMIFNAKLTNLL